MFDTGRLKCLRINTKTLRSRFSRWSISIQQNARIPIAKGILRYDYPEVLYWIQLQSATVVKSASIRGIRGIEGCVKRVCERIGATKQAHVRK